MRYILPLLMKKIRAFPCAVVIDSTKLKKLWLACISMQRELALTGFKTTNLTYELSFGVSLAEI